MKRFFRPVRAISKTVITCLFVLVAAFIAGILYFKLLSPKTKESGITPEADGSVRQVADYIKQNLREPESFHAVHWSGLTSQPDLLGDSLYSVSVVYRAKDESGKTIMFSKRFDFDKRGTIVFEIGVQPFQGIGGHP